MAIAKIQRIIVYKIILLQPLKRLPETASGGLFYFRALLKKPFSSAFFDQIKKIHLLLVLLYFK